uniref:Uncharacterized protein n=1 Tax=Octopus bimaculoides TaxID=37653 RepID=A0A0L8GM15_OCTBM
MDTLQFVAYIAAIITIHIFLNVEKEIFANLDTKHSRDKRKINLKLYFRQY